jgi:hypothetical protein
VTDGSSGSRLPIVIGVEGFGELGDIDADGLRAFFVQELSSKRHSYPHSPILLVSLTAGHLMEILRAAAALCGTSVIESGMPPYRASTARSLLSGEPWVSGAAGDDEAMPFTDCCHVLITVRRSRAGADGDPVRSDPRKNLAGDFAPNVTSIRLEPHFYVELIEVTLGSAAATSFTVSRNWTAGVEFEPAFGKKLGDHALRRTDAFNRDAAALLRFRDPVGVQGDNLPLVGGIPSMDESARMQRLFSVADTLSNDCQARVTRAFQTIFMLASMAALLYGLFLIFGSGNVLLQEWLLAAYLLTLLAAYMVYYRAKRRDLHERFVEYRALAEGVRVQIYWAACGVDRAVLDSYLVRHPPELNWIRLALRWITWAACRGMQTKPDSDSAQAALRQWIDREKGYYARSSARSLRSQARARTSVSAIFVLGGCATALVLLQSLLTPLAPFLKPINLLSFMCSSIAAALVALVYKLGVVYRAQHHSRMLALYAQAERYVNLRTPGPAADIAIALGEATLRESEEWTMFRRDRRIDEPTSPFRRPW